MHIKHATLGLRNSYYSSRRENRFTISVGFLHVNAVYYHRSKSKVTVARLYIPKNILTTRVACISNMLPRGYEQVTVLLTVEDGSIMTVDTLRVTITSCVATGTPD